MLIGVIEWNKKDFLLSFFNALLFVLIFSLLAASALSVYMVNATNETIINGKSYASTINISGLD